LGEPSFAHSDNLAPDEFDLGLRVGDFLVIYGYRVLADEAPGLALGGRQAGLDE
jgi:hypothetical protein